MSNGSASPQRTHQKNEDLPAVPVGQSPVSKFREFLELRNLKVTGERLRIVEHVFERHEHFDAEELVLSMNEKNLRVSRSTIYRTLALLVEAGLLRELRFGGRTAYEHEYGYPHHEHLYCSQCGAVIEFMNEDLEKLLEEICRGHRFRPVRHRLVVEGICERCNRPRAPRSKLDLI